MSCNDLYQKCVAQSVNAFTYPGEMTPIEKCIQQRQACIETPSNNGSEMFMKATPVDNIEPFLKACLNVIEADINQTNPSPADSQQCLMFVNAIQTAMESAMKDFKNLTCTQVKNYVDNSPDIPKLVPVLEKLTPSINTGLKSLSSLQNTMAKTASLYNCAITEINSKYNQKIEKIDMSVFNETQRMRRNYLIGCAIILILTIIICYYLFKK